MFKVLVGFVSAEFKKISVDRPKYPVPEREVPPYNGFGSYEDSLGNCDSLLPKPPRKDFLKFMEKDRWIKALYKFFHSFQRVVLNFVYTKVAAASYQWNMNKNDNGIYFLELYNCSDPSWGGGGGTIYSPGFFLLSQFWPIDAFIVESWDWYH